MQSQVGYGMYSGETLTTLLDDNKTLLEEFISSSEIQRCVDLLRTRKHIRFLKFLAALCAAHGKAVTKNQETISEALFQEDNYRSLMVISLQHDNIHLTWEDPQGTSARVSPDTPIIRSEVIQGSKDQLPLLEFLQAQLSLLSLLCFDRNYIAIDFLRPRWPKALLLKGLESKKFSA